MAFEGAFIIIVTAISVYWFIHPLIRGFQVMCQIREKCLMPSK